MFTVEKSVVIDRSAEDVFAYVSDQTNAPRWQRGLTEVRRTTDGPIGIGTRHVVTRTFMGRRLQLANEYTRFERNRIVEFRVFGTIPGLASYEVQSEGSQATRLVARIEMRPAGAARLAEPLMAAALRRDVETALATLKLLLEGESSTERAQ